MKTKIIATKPPIMKDNFLWRILIEGRFSPDRLPAKVLLNFLWLTCSTKEWAQRLSKIAPYTAAYILEQMRVKNIVKILLAMESKPSNEITRTLQEHNPQIVKEIDLVLAALKKKLGL